MNRDPLHERIVDQFSYRGEGADVWRAFDRFLDTDAFLNLGYSPRYLPHVVGSSQRRLAEVVGRELADALAETTGVRLLDVGCGRGGPATTLVDAFGFDVTGVDLVPYNVRTARQNAQSAGAPVEFVVGDATSLPIATDSVDAATAIDAFVYVPDGPAAFGELARVVRPSGVVAVSDLVGRGGGRQAATDLDSFASSWDVSALVSLDRYLDDVSAAGFDVEAVRVLSPNSVGRFRKWARLYLWLADRNEELVDRTLGRLDLDPERVTEHVATAATALPHLEHVLVLARNGAVGGVRNE